MNELLNKAVINAMLIFEKATEILKKDMIKNQRLLAFYQTYFKIN